MFDLLFESFRKASESSMQMPMDITKKLTQQLPSASGAAMEWSKTLQKRWAEFAIESLNKHRESINSTYRTEIQLIEQTFRVSDVKSSADYQRIVEELWQKLLDVFKEQSESQVRELQTWAAKSLEMQRDAA
jgi:methylthioribose-1-phosphate isomerase